MAGEIADYEITGTLADDNVLPVLQARRPQRLGAPDEPVSIWILGPLSRTPLAAVKARLEPVAAVVSQGLPLWLEAGPGRCGDRPVVWVSAAGALGGTLALSAQQMRLPERLRAIASAARAAHALHEKGVLHAGICPQSLALAGSDGQRRALLGPPSLADGVQTLAHVGYPPIGFMDPQLLRGEGGRWSDIWALGALARYVAVGSGPYPGIEELPVVRALAQLLDVPPAAPAELPTELAGLVDACLARDPAARPATAEEVAATLEEGAAKLWAS